MIEQIRVSLWDILTFFLTGLLFSLGASTYVIAVHYVELSNVLELFDLIPAGVFIVLAPLVMTVIGLLFEPLANYFDKLISPVWKMVFPPKEKHQEEENKLKNIILEKYLSDLGSAIDNPYHICKEYVETHRLSSTFMVFLSRYGFYRNAAAIFYLAAILAAVHSSSLCFSIAIALGFLGLGLLMKKRAEDFYSYLAPCVYRCYLGEKALRSGDKPAS